MAAAETTKNLALEIKKDRGEDKKGMIFVPFFMLKKTLSINIERVFYFVFFWVVLALI